MRYNKSIWKYTLKRERIIGISEDKMLGKPEFVAEFLRAIDFHNLEQEHMISIVLDAKNKIKGFYTVGVGTIEYTVTHAREVFRLAIMQGASSIILAHCHPSGEVEPSNEDINITRKMRAAGEIIGISVVDHVIVGESGYYSFVNHKLK